MRVCVFFLFYILLYYYLSQDIEYISLCYTIRLCYISILYIIICICWPQSPTPLHPSPTSHPPWQQKVCSRQWDVFCFIGSCMCVCAESLSHVWLFPTPWTAACQTSLSMEFCKQEYWNRLPFPSPGDLPNPGIKPVSLAPPTLASGFFTNCAIEKPREIHVVWCLSFSLWVTPFSMIISRSTHVAANGIVSFFFCD